MVNDILSLGANVEIFSGEFPNRSAAELLEKLTMHLNPCMPYP